MGPVVAGLRTLAVGGLSPPLQEPGGMQMVKDVFKRIRKAPQWREKYPRKLRAGITTFGILIPSSGSRLRPTPRSNNLSESALRGQNTWG